MRIKKGEWYRFASATHAWLVFRAGNDMEDDPEVASDGVRIRVVVRDAKPRVRIKLSEELAWLMTQLCWSIHQTQPLSEGGPIVVTIGSGFMYTAEGPTIAKAIYRLRKIVEGK